MSKCDVLIRQGKWKPKWGEEIEAKCDLGKWRKGLFIAFNPKPKKEWKYIVICDGIVFASREIRKPVPIKVITMQEIADKFGVSVDEIEIIDIEQ